MKEIVNRLAPDFVLPRLGGGRLGLADLRGSVAVLNFWSAQCLWSRRADVFLVYRQLTWERRGVRVVGIVSNLNETEVEIRYEAESRHVRYPILLDVDRRVAEIYRAETTPHFFVVDRQGLVRYNGALDDATQQRRRAKTFYLDQAVAAVLENRAPDPGFAPPYGCAMTRDEAAPGGTAIEPVAS